MKHHILDSYRLPTKQFTLIKREVIDNNLYLRVTPRTTHTICKSCKIKSTFHYDTRQNLSKIKYDSWYGHVIYLCFNKRRFTCSVHDCSAKVFTEVISTITEPYRRSSDRFEKQCLNKLKTNTFKHVQSEMNISYSFLSKQLHQRVPTRPERINWAKEFEDEEYIILGVDEHSLKKRHLATTITNITKKQIITILPDYTNIFFEQFIRSIPSNYRKRIKFVAMDLTNRYRSVVGSWLPNAEIVADHFHLIGVLNRLLWSEKKVIEGVYRKHKIKHFKLLLKGKEKLLPAQKKVVTDLLKYKPYAKLKRAYKLKEEVRTICRMENVPKAIQKLDKLTRQSQIWNSHRTSRTELMKYSTYYRTMIKTVKKFQKEIAVFLETRITNAFTEGVHTKIKLLKRLSFGLPNKQIYIKRMILAFCPSFHQL